ncbi:MAG: AraC family transcriptional regulator [Clostridia bacterium]|nr:AraC family transcriptional regulator [Clostridia bacterium]MBR6602813.1 AraC family transcriptional regulator [Clostridia bacterium]
MHYINRINQILDYIEENLYGDLSYARMAEMMTMSVYEFRRIFAFIIGTPLSDYIRLRRLSSAAFDLQDGSLSITEISAKCHYDSPAAFSRAFREMQGISPTDARQPGTVLKNYPRASLAVSISGMTNISFRLVKREAMTVCGYSGVSALGDCCCEDIWDAFYEGGCHDRLSEGFYRDLLGGTLGQYAAYENVSDTVRCTIGAILPAEATPPEGMDTITIPPALWGVFDFTGATPEKLNTAYYQTLADWLTSSVYERDPDIPNLEAFSVDSDEDSETLRWQIWYPLRNKKL